MRVLHVRLRCGSLSIKTPVSLLANEFDVGNGRANEFDVRIARAWQLSIKFVSFMRL